MMSFPYLFFLLSEVSPGVSPFEVSNLCGIIGAMRAYVWGSTGDVLLFLGTVERHIKLLEDYTYLFR